MEHITISLWSLALLIAVALAFDFMNGFHDGANSISTIVATGALTPKQAVLFAAFGNFAAYWLVGLHVAETVGKGIVNKHQRCHLRQQARSIEIGLVHGLSTSRPSAERDTQGRSLPVGSVAGSSLAAQGSDASRPSCRHSRTVLTFVQRCNSSRSTSARRL